MRKVAIVGALGAAALGLVGIGTQATFTDAVASSQQVTAGHMDVQLSSADAGATQSADKKSVSFANLGPVNSTFTSPTATAVITNKGNIAVNAWKLSIAHTTDGTSASTTLASELGVKLMSEGQVIFDGPLSTFEANPIMVTGPIAPNGTDGYTVQFYAGAGVLPSLTNAAQDGVVVPTVRVDYVG
jgi:predicted ribosomally synthesized peptide with SipW-like signal peptide